MGLESKDIRFQVNSDAVTVGGLLTTGKIALSSEAGDPGFIFRLASATHKIPPNRVWGGSAWIFLDVRYAAITCTTLTATGIFAPYVRATTTAGLLIEASNGTDVGTLGAGNTANVAWLGAHTFAGLVSANAGLAGTTGTFTGAVSALTLAAGGFASGQWGSYLVSDHNSTTLFPFTVGITTRYYTGFGPSNKPSGSGNYQYGHIISSTTLGGTNGIAYTQIAYDWADSSLQWRRRVRKPSAVDALVFGDWEKIVDTSALIGVSYIPYTGADKTVNLGSQALTTSGLITANGGIAGTTGTFTGLVKSGTTTLGNTPPVANNDLTRKDYVDVGLSKKISSVTIAERAFPLDGADASNRSIGIATINTTTPCNGEFFLTFRSSAFSGDIVMRCFYVLDGTYLFARLAHIDGNEYPAMVGVSCISIVKSGDNYTLRYNTGFSLGSTAASCKIVVEKGHFSGGSAATITLASDAQAIGGGIDGSLFYYGGKSITAMRELAASALRVGSALTSANSDWQFVVSGSQLLIQQKQSGSWVTISTIQGI